MPAPPAPARTSRFWSGFALGADEAAELFLARDPRFVVIAGDEDAGKTCLLTAQYIAVARGRAPDFGWRFCGSRTLRGFDRLADAAFEWSGSQGDPIVPRTNTGSHREPGYLHLALSPRVYGRSEATLRRVDDVVLTDMPGEWFDRWVAQKDYAGRLPFLARADAVWAVIDLPRCLGASGRKARSRARDLLDAIVTLDRPFALVFTKADTVTGVPDAPGDPEAWGEHAPLLRSILEPLSRARRPHAIFAAAAFPGRPAEVGSFGVLAPLSWVLGLPRGGEEAPLPREGARYFQLFRESAQ